MCCVVCVDVGGLGGVVVVCRGGVDVFGGVGIVCVDVVVCIVVGGRVVGVACDGDVVVGVGVGAGGGVVGVVGDVGVHVVARGVVGVVVVGVIVVMWVGVGGVFRVGGVGGGGVVVVDVGDGDWCGVMGGVAFVLWSMMLCVVLVLSLAWMPMFMLCCCS